MTYTKPQSPCARCDEAYEYEWPEALAIYCGAVEPGERCLIEVQRLKHPRGSVRMCTEGPLPACPKKRGAGGIKN